MRELNQTRRVWIGVSSPIVKGFFVTIEGLPMAGVCQKWEWDEPNNYGGLQDCVMMSSEGFMNDQPCSDKHSFVCKKTWASVEWNADCGMAYTDYTYNETLGRCYKFHQFPKSWPEAFAICSAELSYLAVIDNQDEADFFLDVFSAYTDVENQPYATAHLGFHKMTKDSWNTVKGTPAEQQEYFFWGEGQPDGADAEKCGAMSLDGLLCDVDCSTPSSFICEHEF